MDVPDEARPGGEEAKVRAPRGAAGQKVRGADSGKPLWQGTRARRWGACDLRVSRD